LNYQKQLFMEIFSTLKRKDFFELRGRKYSKANSFLRIISNLVGRSDPLPCCPGKKAGAEDKKGREKSLKVPPLCFRKETRGQRDNRAETAEARM